RWLGRAALLVAGLGACDEDVFSPSPCVEGESRGPDGRCRSEKARACLPPGELDRDACITRPCPAGHLQLEDGACQPAGVSPDRSCPPGELVEEGACRPAGVSM